MSTIDRRSLTTDSPVLPDTRAMDARAPRHPLAPRRHRQGWAALGPLVLWCGAALAGGQHAAGHAHPVDGRAAIGNPGRAADVRRTVRIDMRDAMRFSPAAIQVRRGETVRLVVRNTGRIRHELSLGTREDLLEHLEQMKKFPGMEHDEPNQITLEPGQQGDIVWTFSRAGTVDFACLIPGHYEAGMKGRIRVSPPSSARP